MPIIFSYSYSYNIILYLVRALYVPNPDVLLRRCGRQKGNYLIFIAPLLLFVYNVRRRVQQLMHNTLEVKICFLHDKKKTTFITWSTILRYLVELRKSQGSVTSPFCTRALFIYFVYVYIILWKTSGLTQDRKMPSFR